MFDAPFKRGASDLVVADTPPHHPKGVSQAYADIGAVLAGFGFERVQGSLADTAGALQAICDLDLTDLHAIEPPKGFGRDCRHHRNKLMVATACFNS